MIRRIIVEGADQQGKSTLCKLLSEELGWKVIHYGKPNADFDFTTGYKLPENTISDRNFLSEIVYSKVVDRIPRAAMMLQCNIHKHDDTLLILLDREEHFKFDSNRSEDYDQGQILKAIGLYRKEFGRLNMEKMKLNPNSENYSQVINLILNSINEDTQGAAV
jgi:nicotinamide riboside kinase